jgi:hypothetical protein
MARLRPGRGIGYPSVPSRGGFSILASELWKLIEAFWKTGEVVSLPFVSIHFIEDGKIKLWRDYWDFQRLMSGAPAWWIEHLAKHTEADFGG